MWRAYNALGFLEYSFVETVDAMHPFYLIRAVGGFLFLVGALLMVVNIWKTIAEPSSDAVPASRPALVPAE
jgi:cytochrome c oxidase cbb3-type subunit 1